MNEIILFGNTRIQECDWCEPGYVYVSNGKELYKFRIAKGDE